MCTWDDTEYSQLSTADSIDTVSRIIGLEEVLFSKILDSLEPSYLRQALSRESAKKSADELLSEHVSTIQPDLDEAADKMKLAYESLFILENSLRQFIQIKLKNEFSDDWWAKGATRGAKTNAAHHKEDTRWKWHEPIENSPLHYIDFTFLKDIIWPAPQKLVQVKC